MEGLIRSLNLAACNEASPSLCERMEAKGVDMQWYRRGARNKAAGVDVPLADDQCYIGSIYLLKTDGSLWTVTGSNKPYKQVRIVARRLKRPMFICVSCGAQASTNAVVHNK